MSNIADFRFQQNPQWDLDQTFIESTSRYSRILENDVGTIPEFFFMCVMILLESERPIVEQFLYLF